MIKEGTRRLSDIVTGDELWFYQRHIAKRESNKTWVYEGEKPKTVVRQSRFEHKTTFSVFFKRSGLVHLCFLERGKPINHSVYL